MTNLNGDLSEQIIDPTKYQVMHVKLTKEDGTDITLPLPMPYVFRVEELKGLLFGGISISAPLDLPPDTSIAEVSTSG